ncbi:hypothetical protein MLD38_021668 [Melastoma candidum]|uniref:Uncharacterized protein n=1 Tax=Melastoma candidum TaxID=119954 RepID=A0ACB9QKN0_9MYRT|nr:hypothetical protein MLD38_021668 [Melastoma candidum]
MSNIGGYAVARAHPDSRFYHPPPVRRQRQQLFYQQRQRREGFNRTESRVDPADGQTSRVVSVEEEEEEAAVSRQPSSPAVKEESGLTNLDRLIEAVTPSVGAQNFNEVRMSRLPTPENDSQLYYLLEDLWESFREWSVYGVGVPLLLNHGECVKQYYVPSLSGIQLYIDPARLRSNDADVKTPRQTSSGSSSDHEVERKAKSVTDTSQKMNGLTILDKLPISNEVEVHESSGSLVFHYVEQEQPYNRKPFYDKISNLASQFPDLKKYRSCDILPTSWISVAWYPIYRIPVGPTLQNLDASFLTFHRLSTHSRSISEPHLHVLRGERIIGTVSPTKYSVPVFGLASYKLKSSILNPSGTNECQKAANLLQVAGDWLQKLQVNLPDYQFFVSHSSTQWR